MLTEYTLKLKSVEARCKILEKQLHCMRKMAENGNKERKAVIEQQVLQPSANLHLQIFIQNQAVSQRD